MPVKQNSTAGFFVDMVSSTDKESGVEGLTLTCKLSKSGGASAVVVPTQIVDVDDGGYWVVPIAAHRDTLGMNRWFITGTGAAPVSYYEEVTPADWEDVGKVPRASAAMAGGANFTRNKVSEAANDMTENFS